MVAQMNMAQQTVTRKKSILDNNVKSDSLTKKVRPFESFIRGLLFFCGFVSILTTLGIVYVLAGESLLFFNSRAWVIAKIPIIDEVPSATVTEGIDANETVLSISFDGERIPFNTTQFITIGNEVMQITDRGRSTITVTRGLENTIPEEHPSDQAVFGMKDTQIKPLNTLSPEDTIIEIPAGYGSHFEIGEEIQLGNEVMRVTDINNDQSQLTVERGTSGTEAREHDTNEALNIPRYVTFGEFITSTTWSPQVGNFGIWPLLLATIIISTVAIIVAVPLGLGAAIYLSEYAKPRVRSILKPILEILAGIPTVVFGFFALTFVTPLLQSLFGQQVQFYNMLSAGVVVGILLIPLISSMSEDALSAVPMALREASYGLGATKLETTIKVVVPAAISGIMAAIILAISRAVGETMIVAIAAGSGPNFTTNLFEGAETMTGHIARISGGDLSYNSIDYNSIFAIGATLFVLTLVLNLISGWVRDLVREEY